jgi:16S rRNA processing protein RimM
LTLGASVSVAGVSAAIVRRAGTEQHPIVRLEGVEDRAAAEALRGEDLTVAAQQAPALAEGEWWAHELEGCAVVADGTVLGQVRRLVELPSCEALEVDRGAGGEPLLVPMVKDAVLRVAVEQKRIEVNAEFLDIDPERASADAQPARGPSGG